MAAAKQGSTIRVQQKRSGLGYNKDQKATLKALGLGKIGRIREHPDNPQVRGMINKVTHLVEIVTD
jgi:large subunit ribosomal protein L30